MVTLKDIVDCYIPRNGVEVKTTKCPKYGSWTVEIRNEHGLCFRKSDYEPDWQFDLERELAYYCMTLSEAMEAIKAEQADFVSKYAQRQRKGLHEPQSRITKRIVGKWLHKRGIPTINLNNGWYKIDAGYVALHLRVGDNGRISVRRYYTGLAGMETASGLNGLISFVNDLGA